MKFELQTLPSGIHAIAGGKGETVVLLPGWPETAKAYEEMLPLLAEHYSVLALDPPGLGDSAPSQQGYSTAAVSTVLEQAVATRSVEAIHLVGHDVGAWIAYAWAAQYPHRIRTLALLDSSLPGLAPSQNYPLPPELNVKLWQFSFNMLPALPELLTAGRERELINWLVQQKAVHPERVKAIDHYVDCYARPGAMSRGFEYYRATPKSGAENREFSKQQLSIPVLALGGQTGVGESLKTSLQSLASNVDGGTIADCGHYVMEEQPDVVANQLLAFFQRGESESL
ncbi:MAG: alpha/beta hydrolase [Verrucomicrobia bacterium]|nr:alpha/beta hydrolase [Verrucomicrobiota bacterium]